MLAFTGTADAKKKHKKKKLAPIVTATATATGVSASQIVSATATCPGKTKAVGGGLSTPPLAPMPVDAGLATASHKVGTTQWLASMEFIGEPGPPVVLTTTVYCRKGAPGTTPVTVTTSLPQAGSGSTPIPANATCPAGTVQLSGGWAIDRIFNPGSDLVGLPLSSNRLDPLTWQATALATEPGHTLTSQADCAKQPKAKKGKKGKKKKKKKLVTPTEVTGDTTTAVAIQNTTAIATCPVGMSPVNGGFSQPGFNINNPFFFFITESQAVGGTWRVTGFAEGDGVGTLRSHGYCSR
jgi:hypothetical protein